MEDSSYLVVEKIKLGGKEFQCFLTSKYKRIFLRIENGKYYYPTLLEYQKLSNFYKNDSFIVAYSKNISKRVKPFIAAVLTTAGIVLPIDKAEAAVGNDANNPSYSLSEQVGNNQEQELESIPYVSIKEKIENGRLAGKITSIDELPKVSLDDIKEKNKKKYCTKFFYILKIIFRQQ